MTASAWHMPAEWEPQERIWMAFPSGGYTLGDNPADAERARAAWAAVASACVDFEPVCMLVDPAALDASARHLDSRIEIVPAPLDDAWMRDIGPTFVHAADGTVAGIDWVFNGWGAQSWARWGHDQHIARFVSAQAGCPVVTSPLVNEGGGFAVDGQGTALATRSVQLDPHRNPHLDEQQVEQEFARVLGVDTLIWLDRGLTRDAQRFGTRGHVDIVAAFAAPGVVLVHDQRDPNHPDHQVSAEVVETLQQARDDRGRAFEIVRVPAPRRLSDDEGWVDQSYLNHLLVNHGVIACTFDDPHDDEALQILQQVHPQRRVVGVDARELFARGGGVHCITQQQPLPRRSS